MRRDARAALTIGYAAGDGGELAILQHAIDLQFPNGGLRLGLVLAHCLLLDEGEGDHAPSISPQDLMQITCFRVRFVHPAVFSRRCRRWVNFY